MLVRAVELQDGRRVLADVREAVVHLLGEDRLEVLAGDLDRLDLARRLLVLCGRRAVRLTLTASVAARVHRTGSPPTLPLDSEEGNDRFPHQVGKVCDCNAGAGKNQRKSPDSRKSSAAAETFRVAGGWSLASVGLRPHVLLPPWETGRESLPISTSIAEIPRRPGLDPAPLGSGRGDSRRDGPEEPGSRPGLRRNSNVGRVWTRLFSERIGAGRVPGGTGRRSRVQTRPTAELKRRPGLDPALLGADRSRKERARRQLPAGRAGGAGSRPGLRRNSNVGRVWTRLFSERIGAGRFPAGPAGGAGSRPGLRTRCAPGNDPAYSLAAITSSPPPRADRPPVAWSSSAPRPRCRARRRTRRVLPPRTLRTSASE